MFKKVNERNSAENVFVNGEPVASKNKYNSPSFKSLLVLFMIIIFLLGISYGGYYGYNHYFNKNKPSLNNTGNNSSNTNNQNQNSGGTVTISIDPPPGVKVKPRKFVTTGP